MIYDIGGHSKENAAIMMPDEIHELIHFVLQTLELLLQIKTILDWP